MKQKVLKISLIGVAMFCFSQGAIGQAKTGSTGLWLEPDDFQTLSNCDEGEKKQVTLIFDLSTNFRTLPAVPAAGGNPARPSPAPTLSASVPFIITAPSDIPTFTSGQTLVIAIEVPPAVAASEDYKLLHAIGLSIDFAKSNPINPAPARPSFSAASITGAGNLAAFIAGAGAMPKYLCWTWPTKLAGDTIPTITINAVMANPDPTKPESTVTLHQVAYPQVHSLSYFNIATGVVGSTIHNPSFIRSKTALASGSTPAQFATVKDNGDPTVHPVLFFSAYLFHPLDAETQFHWSDMIPAPGVGFSLTAPAGNFFFGGSSEFFRRNVQIIYGLHYGQVTHLAPTGVDDPSSSTAPVTQQRFSRGTFAGLTFNIDFIKGLFGGK